MTICTMYRLMCSNITKHVRKNLYLKYQKYKPYIKKPKPDIIFQIHNRYLYLNFYLLTIWFQKLKNTVQRVPFLWYIQSISVAIDAKELRFRHYLLCCELCCIIAIFVQPFVLKILNSATFLQFSIYRLNIKI